MNSINVKKMEDSQTIGVVYDISLDGTVVNALGMNVISNTDGQLGFNFQKPLEFRYTKEHPYISNGNGRNSVKGKAYTEIFADIAEFEDMYLSKAYDGGINKMGLGLDEECDALTVYGHVKPLLIDLELPSGQQGASRNVCMFRAA